MPAKPPISQENIARQLDICAQIAEENAAAHRAPLAFVDTPSASGATFAPWATLSPTRRRTPT